MAQRVTKVTTDHETIRRWAEERGGTPAEVIGTGREGEPGIIRIDFPGYTGEGKLRPISWDEWSRKFDETNLAFLYEETTATGEKSNFNKLVGRETVEARARGERTSRRAMKKGAALVAGARGAAAARGRRRGGGRAGAGGRSRTARSTSAAGAGGRGRRQAGGRGTEPARGAGRRKAPRGQAARTVSKRGGRGGTRGAKAGRPSVAGRTSRRGGSRRRSR